MRPLFKNCYHLDKRCSQAYGLSEDILMENAASAISKFITEHYPNRTVFIAAGPGNNGADGIAVARQLHQLCEVKLFLPLGAKSPMAKLQLQRAKCVGVNIVETIDLADIVLDALFGAGLSKPLNMQICNIVEKLNAMDAVKIACDIPTGVFETGYTDAWAFKADHTLTMGALKQSLYADLSLDYVGNVQLIDLGVSHRVYADTSDSFVLEESDYHPPLRTSKSSHKGNFGHLNIFAGQKQGASILSGMSAMKFGTGLVTLVTNEAIQIPYSLMKDTHLSPNCTAIAVGMGLGNEYLDSFLEKEIVNKEIPILLDADALSNAVLLQILNQKKRKIVLTPHPKEFCTLLQFFNEDIDTQTLQKNRFYYAKAFSLKHPHLTLVLKGANTIIAQNGKTFVNPFHDNKLAQAGSGDILSGLIAALLAQGYETLDAALSGSLALSFAAKSYKGANYSACAQDFITHL